MASDRQAPVPRMVAPDETRPVDVSGANSRPLPRRPPPPRNPQPPPASRISTRERLEAAASRFMDDLPDGVGIPDDDDDPQLADDSSNALDIELDLDGPAATDFDEAATRSYVPAVDGQAKIESVLGIPSDDDSAMFRIKAGTAQPESSVISSAAPPARAEPESPRSRPPAPPPSNAGPVVTGKTMVPGSVPAMQSGPAVTGKTVVPGAAQAPRRGPAPPSMSSLGMRKPADTQEIDLDDIETTDGPEGAEASSVGDTPARVPAPRPREGSMAKPPAPAPTGGPPGADGPAEQAARSETPAAPTSTPAPAPASAPPASASAPVSAPVPEPTSRRPPSADVVVAEAQPPTTVPDAPRRGRAGLWVAVVGVLLIAGGVGAWQAGLLDPWLTAEQPARVAAADTKPSADVPPSPTDAADPAPAADPVPAADPTDPADDGGPLPSEPAEPGVEPAASEDAVDTESTPALAEPTATPEPETDPVAPEDPPVVPPAIPAGPASLETARKAIATDPAQAYALAEKANQEEPSDAALEIMATAGCAADDGKPARKAFRSLGDAEARRRVTDYCLEKTEINILAKTNDYTGPEHLRRAQRQYQAGEHEAALESIKESQKIKRTPEAGELQVVVYCAQDNLKKARYMLRRMRPSSRETATKACEDMGRVIGEL